MQFDIGNGLANAGTAVAATAGTYALEAQKADLEKEKVLLADQLAGAREEKGRQFTTGEREATQKFTGGQNDLTRQNQLDTTKMHVAGSLGAASIAADASRYSTDKRTEVEREALTPAEVRTAQWFSKASPAERAAFQSQLAIKAGLPAWAAGGGDSTPSTGATVTPVQSGPTGSAVDTGTAPGSGTPDKKADAGNSSRLPMPTVDPDKLNQAPQEARGTLKMMLEGRMAPPTSFAMSKPYWQEMIGLANKIDPTFDETSWAARLATRKDFTSGKSAVAITAMNTALGHADRLMNKMDALDNFGGIGTPLNAPVNAVKNFFGDDRQGRAVMVRDAMASEARKVFAATGGGGLKELENWEKNFDLSGSPEKMKGQVEEFVGLLDSRLGSLSEQYNRGMGVSSEPLRLLTPEARAAFERITGATPQNATGYQTGKAPANTPSTAAPSALPPENQRAIGRTYQTPTGPHIWMGNGWAASPPQGNP